MRLLAPLCIIFSCLGAQPSDALPGSDDPALAAAAERWINDEDAIEAMIEVGALAADGNIAAQYFANRMYYLHDFDNPNRLSRDELVALFAPLEGDSRSRRFTPYHLTGQGHAALDARLEINADLDAETWIEMAEVMLAAGFRQSVLSEFTANAWSSSRRLASELMPYISDIAQPTDRATRDLWGYLAIEMAGMEIFPDPDREALWTVHPGDWLERTGFYTALEEGSWSTALAVTLWSQSTFVPDSAALDDSPVVRIVEIYNTILAHDQSASADEIDEFGSYLLTQAETLPYLRPNARVCRTACPSDAANCMASGTMVNLGNFIRPRSFEPVLSEDVVYGSVVAERGVLARVASLVEMELELPLALPQCLINAAEVAIP
ncbi:MAG: hypothetical protein AAF376_05680 [Pseudomonadota bacterium]